MLFLRYLYVKTYIGISGIYIFIAGTYSNA